MTPARTLAAVLALLIAANILANRVVPDALVVGIALTLCLLLIARLAHLSPEELGLNRKSWGRGARWGGVAGAAVVIAYGLGMTVPGLREAVSGVPAPSVAEALLKALVVIPLATVIPEELAFRGVLLGLLRRHGTMVTASVISSAVFALWHILPALNIGPTNATVVDLVGDGLVGTGLRVGGTLVLTFLGGLVFCWLRNRSDSLLAPILFHAAVNGVGELALLVYGQR